MNYDDWKSTNPADEELGEPPCARCFADGFSECRCEPEEEPLPVLPSLADLTAALDAPAGYSLYSAFRSDGWPLCPNCGADELWSSGIGEAPDFKRNLAECIATIEGCYACDWIPQVQQLEAERVRSVLLDAAQTAIIAKLRAENARLTAEAGVARSLALQEARNACHAVLRKYVDTGWAESAKAARECRDAINKMLGIE